MAQEKSATLWVLSNRVDDRVVLWERDPAHPDGGEAFVAGSTPAFVGRTGTVERLLQQGLLLEVPEPKDGPKKPTPIGPSVAGVAAAMPGQATRLGRTPDPDLFPSDAIAKVEQRQEELPDEVPVPAGTVVPQAPTSERETRRR
jgi:hypothetical protein